jgi:2-C-methyl-D-erythritol 2,4-cyclodiphosphate synthase
MTRLESGLVRPAGTSALSKREGFRNSRMYRIGIGNDTHPLVEGRPLILGGVHIDSDRGGEGHSDADALLHAIADAILGALCEGDLGVHFPDDDPQWRDASSLHLLSRVVWLAHERGSQIVNVDATVMLETPKLRPYIFTMREKIAEVLAVEPSRVSVKAKTAEGLDAVGQGLAVSAQAVVMITSS